MIRTLDDLALWCARVPALEPAGPSHWRQSIETAISYPSEGLGALADIEARSYWFNHRNAVIGEVVRQFPPSGPIFDIGGGNGFVSLGLRQAGFPAVVVEPDPVGAATALARGLPVIEAAFQDIDLPLGSLPAVGMFDVLEHIEDDAGTLRRLHDALEPGGLLYVAVPALDWLWSDVDEHSGHFRRYTTKDLGRRLHTAGLTPLYSTYFFGVLIPAILLFRSLPRYVGRRIKLRDRQVEADHSLPRGAAGKLITASFSREIGRVESGGSLALGSSCLVVARKDGAGQ